MHAGNMTCWTAGSESTAREATTSSASRLAHAGATGSKAPQALAGTQAELREHGAVDGATYFFEVQPPPKQVVLSGCPEPSALHRAARACVQRQQRQNSEHQLVWQAQQQVGVWHVWRALARWRAGVHTTSA